MSRATLNFHLNGRERAELLGGGETLLSLLRYRLETTSIKQGCKQGTCGSCTVIVDGRPAYSCLLLAADCVGRSIRTVEGLGEPEALSPVQDAFCEHDALMCGFCTPGFVVATTACLERNPGADLEEIKEKLSGNLCRCGTYPHIFDAARTAGRQMGAERKGDDR